MGDRGNIAIREGRGNGDVWLYTHWGGRDLKKTAKAALRRGMMRWNDPAYLARIVFCEMIGDDADPETGFGISTRMGDNEHPILVIDTMKQSVFTVPESEIDSDGKLPKKLTEGTSFSEFIT